jgi:hypothetical protein
MIDTRVKGEAKQAQTNGVSGPGLQMQELGNTIGRMGHDYLGKNDN